MEEKPYKTDVQASENIICEPLVKYDAIVLDPTKQYSYADYLTWVDDKRREIFDGIVKLMSGPAFIHANISGNFFGRVWPFVKKRKGKCKVIHAPIDVRLPKNGEIADDKIFNVVQPDIVVVCDLSKIDEKGIIGAPDVAVEVLSPSNTKLMMRTKFDLYEEAGVKEYWVVYPKAGVTVFLLQENGKYDNGTTYDVVYTPDAKIPVHTIDGLEISLKELFEE
jgi:Uma2 family endonuclease